MSSKVWDQRFMEMALLVAGWSKDTNTKVGAVVVGPGKELLTVGYNGFPRGVDDEVVTRYERPLKYLWTIHAEENAIFNASRIGVSLAGATIYVNGNHGFPCAPCARAIVQCGIKRLVGLPPDMSNEKYADEYRETIKMFQEAGVSFRSIVKTQ
jgi:dCMP deaminase